MKQKTMVRIIAVVLAALMAISLVSFIIPTRAIFPL